MIIKRNGTVIGSTGKEIGTKDSKGYVLIRLGKHEPTIKRCVLVAQEYLNWYEGCEVHHKNGVRDDDRVSNLEVLTPFQHRLKHNKIKIIGRINNGTIDRVYNSISDAELDNGLPHNHSHINEVISGKQDTCGGYGWVSLEYPKIILKLAEETQKSVTEEERVECFALIYKALLSEVQFLLPLLSRSKISNSSLLSVFKGFHF